MSHNENRCSDLLNCANHLLEKLEKLREELSNLQNQPEEHQKKIGEMIQHVEYLVTVMREKYFYHERYMLQMKKVKWGAIYLAIYLFIYGVGNFLVLSALWGKLFRTNPPQLEEVIVFALTWVLVVSVGVVGLAYTLKVFSQMIDPKDPPF